MHLDLSGARWRKSTFSGQGGECIEVADGFPGIVPVRDSKDPNGPALILSVASWQSFVTAVRTGEFDAR
ncbi:DUF397 domain-containing protein [Kitasatospora sp. NPDC004669]|uniref:DUF397 domain-containing protein n=1 Tax=Kitasatospora sp. NPDC004669 TaxID=3154555 RepID=UPI0033B850B5